MLLVIIMRALRAADTADLFSSPVVGRLRRILSRNKRATVKRDQLQSGHALAAETHRRTRSRTGATQIRDFEISAAPKLIEEGQPSELVDYVREIIPSRSDRDQRVDGGETEKLESYTKRIRSK